MNAERMCRMASSEPTCRCAVLAFALALALAQLFLVAASPAEAATTMAATAPAGRAPPPNVLAHGTKEFLWVAQVIPARDGTSAHDVTNIYSRSGSSALA